MAKTVNEEKKSRRIVAVTKELRQKKGITIKKHEIDIGLKQLTKAKKDILQMGETDGSEAAKKAAATESEKLQNIIEDLNYYMGIVYPEGLVDIGEGEDRGSTVSISG